MINSVIPIIIPSGGEPIDLSETAMGRAILNSKLYEGFSRFFDFLAGVIENINFIDFAVVFFSILFVLTLFRNFHRFFK